MSVKVINSSRWCWCSEGDITLFSAHVRPASIIPTDCNTPSAFAWVLYNEVTGDLTAARDYLGLEPFYYCYQNQKFVFGTTIPDILNKLPTKPEFNTDRLLDECFIEKQYSMTSYSNETHYQGVYRLDPGSRLHIQNGRLRTEVYWRFERSAPTILYANDQDYIDHFGELLNEIVLSQIQGHEKLCAEYSGGLDSTTVIAACHQNQIELPLFCHVAGEQSPDGGDFSYAECVIEHLNLKDVHYIDATNFDPNSQFQALAEIFAGAPPYLFFIMANNIYQAITKQGCKRILSGFGGDQCVSTHASVGAFYSALLQQKQYQRAWHELRCTNSEAHRIKIFIQLLRYAHPGVHTVLTRLGDVRRIIKCYLQTKAPEEKSQFYKGFTSVRELQLDLLEGELCHEVRMRVEYSAVLGKVMGFSHAYPLLHPKLIDFALRLPPEQQRRNGEGRYLMRRYLAQFVPEKNYKQNKRLGAHIMPAVMQKCKEHEQSGQLDAALQQFPFLDRLEKPSTPHQQLRQKIYAYMINAYRDNCPVSPE